VFRVRVIKYIGWTFAWLAAFVCATWATGALYFDFPAAGLLAIIWPYVVAEQEAGNWSALAQQSRALFSR
jgi:hypothetical protein